MTFHRESEKNLLLYAEDNELITSQVLRLLEREYPAQLQILHFSDGAEIISFLRSNAQNLLSKDLLITDHQMPKAKGVEVIQTALEIGMAARNMLLCTNTVGVGLESWTKDRGASFLDKNELSTIGEWEPLLIAQKKQITLPHPASLPPSHSQPLQFLPA